MFGNSLSSLKLGKGDPSRSINNALTFLICSVVLPFKSVSFTVKNTPAPFKFNCASVLKCSSNVPCTCFISALFLPLSQKV